MFINFFSISPSTHFLNQFHQIIFRNSGALWLGNNQSGRSQDASEWRSQTCARERIERVPFVCGRLDAHHERVWMSTYFHSICVPCQLSRVGTRCQRPGHLAPTARTALPQRHELVADSHFHLLRAVSGFDGCFTAYRLAERWNSGTLYGLWKTNHNHRYSQL